MADATTTDRGARLELWHREGYQRVRANVDAFVAMVQALDSGEQARRVPGMDWNVAEVVSHVDAVCRRYTVDPDRAADPNAVAEANAADITALGTDVGALLDDITQQVELMAMAVDGFEPTREFRFHSGQMITIAGGWGNLIGELLAHGDDIARATDRTFTVPAADLESTWRFTTPVLNGWLTPEGARSDDRWQLDLGFESGPVHLRFGDGRLAIDEPDGAKPDHVILADPVELALTVVYKRREPNDQGIADLAARFAPV